MARAPFQILVLPFRVDDGRPLYAVFHRRDAKYWQFIAGGGEDDEQPIQAARREAWEEAGISPQAGFFQLQSMATVPVVEITGRLTWGEDVIVVPEYTFGVRLNEATLRISSEHTEYRWVDYETARSMLHWHSNRNAVLELNHRIATGEWRGCGACNHVDR